MAANPKQKTIQRGPGSPSDPRKFINSASIPRSTKGKEKERTSLPVICHARHDLEGWNYIDPQWITPSWPVLCSNPDCQEAECKETQKDCYHWDLDWSSESSSSEL
jgi:hypothetical protein